MTCESSRGSRKSQQAFAQCVGIAGKVLFDFFVDPLPRGERLGEKLAALIGQDQGAAAPVGGSDAISTNRRLFLAVEHAHLGFVVAGAGKNGVRGTAASTAAMSSAESFHIQGAQGSP